MTPIFSNHLRNSVHLTLAHTKAANDEIRNINDGWDCGVSIRNMDI